MQIMMQIVLHGGRGRFAKIDYYWIRSHYRYARVYVIWYQQRCGYLQLPQDSLQLSAYNNNSRALRCRTILLVFLHTVVSRFKGDSRGLFLIRNCNSI
ncbi:hypothetical protein PUN28_001666 [Cardiocondyla obscurior]|uniref:Uncharacterized protein n=1 Tax=Cardiocondyla obscurior TaxID=286306 RepID=A0AAW2GQL4_9HYME